MNFAINLFMDFVGMEEAPEEDSAAAKPHGPCTEIQIRVMRRSLGVFDGVPDRISSVWFE